jgi:hypothetical protein
MLLDFEKKIGISPTTACFVYEDMQKTMIVDEARIENPNEKTLTFFLAAIFMLKKYPKEDDLESTMSYELGICLIGGLIWMNGPYLAGTNDITIFRKEKWIKRSIRTTW